MERYKPPKLGGAEQPLLYMPVPEFDYSACCWATPLGSILWSSAIVPASLASQDDTGLWNVDSFAVMIRRMGYGMVTAPQS